MNKISNEEVELLNGEYQATWTGFVLKVELENEDFVEVKTISGCKGVSVPTDILVENGFLFLKG